MYICNQCSIQTHILPDNEKNHLTSRCEGFGMSDTWISLSSYCKSTDVSENIITNNKRS